ncbi:MAG: 2Fe-2S iron-sulfur cluster-binding protein, partial [Nitrospiria bacterium]
MNNLIKLRVNDREIEVEKGTLLIEAAKKAGEEIPHFCYHPKLKPDANCRMCIVEIEKMPKLQTSCSTPAAEGMVVRTNSPKVKEAQFGVMEFLLGNHPLDCPECDQGGECQLQDFAHQNSPTTSRFAEEKRVFKKEYFGPLIEKEMNRCVSCLRCVRYCEEVIDSKALGSFDRGTAHQIGAFAHQELACEYCGGCIQICPVGALTSRLSMYDYRTWQLKKTETICNYCGDGCLLTLEGVKEDITRVSSEMGSGRNEGDLCARGFFGYGMINHPERLARPAIRVNGRDMQVTWEWALDRAVTGLSGIKEKYGPASIGGIISAHCTNEEIYLFQKLMREMIGTPHIDSSAR